MEQQKNRPTLYLMVGLPCSGKTTLAKQIAQEKNAVRFTPDEWHLFLFGDDFHQDELHDERHDRVEELMWQVGQDLLKKGVSVLLDFGFWAKEQRDEKRADALSLGAGFQIFYLDTPMPELLRRLEIRNRSGENVFTAITKKDMEAWAALFQPPEEEELRPVL